MGETSSPRQIETLHPATLTVLLLTHAVARHMMRSTKLPLAFFSLWCYHARVRVHGRGHTHRCIPVYRSPTRCKPRWRPIVHALVCGPRYGGTGRPRPRTATIHLCIDTNHAARLGRRLSNEYQPQLALYRSAYQIL